MFHLATEHSMDAAHFLAGYNGKCGNIHGHRWRVIVTIQGEQLESCGNERGMIVDFSTLKEDVKEMVDYFDHTLIVEENTLKEKTLEALIEEGFCIREVDFRPTAESFSKYFYQILKSKNYEVIEVKVYETPNNCASYSE